MNSIESNAGILSGQVIRLMDKGVHIPNPHAVEIGGDVQIERISGSGVALYSGTKIYGPKTLISAGVKLGYESPVTVADCQLGPKVELKGGFFKASVFLEKANMACGAQVREGCLLEEEANGSHTVGLKQTILFPFVTLGSLINFCDCLMAGGTSRKNHSEVGSSYIHFNYTPNQDKATASLIGDVPRGVMLNQPPIFLGGQGGIVGPARIGYGTLIAAGTVYRGDSPEGGKLLGMQNGSIGSPEKAFHMGFYGDVKRRVYNNCCYLANLLALKQWYIHVRKPFFATQDMGLPLYEGAMEVLQSAVDERLTRFQALSEKMKASIGIGGQILKGHKKKTLLRQYNELMENWPQLKACFTAACEDEIDGGNRKLFIEGLKPAMDKGGGYIEVVQGLDSALTALGTQWLRNICDGIVEKAMNCLPSYSER
ncbi:MAG: UDP-N-acetylglucosamine pyrophosphorylase [Deltaproteobacteria bacterium]|nr:UDP-N-acetylglucosamine pyrophosphorylase [Deltaproteobacteria bacterium]